MGTNFYAVIPVKKRDKEKAKKLIDENKFKEAADFLEDMTKEIHLGKRSAGWKFLFNANLGKYYELTREGINKFFAKNNVIIKDEYGSKYTADEFWESELKGILDKGYDLESYYNEHQSEICSYFDYSQITPPELKKYKPNKYGEFYSDGLRFTIAEDFS